MIVFEKDDLRISLLTSRLLRTEKGAFCDMPTQTVINRDFGKVEHSLTETDKYLEIKTSDVLFRIKKSNGNVVYAAFENTSTKHFGKNTLPGTARTLDLSNGRVRMEKGITSFGGTSIMDDSKSLILNADESISAREKCADRYWFAYGHDYLGQLGDFFRLTGEVPLIPKYTLGNWWSRYKAYTQEEYTSLMQTFIDKKLPITVATIDMDWHWTDVVERFGKEAKAAAPSCKSEIIYNLLLPGWTGYTWNTELFPKHKKMLDWLHENGFKVPLNIHPSQGVRFFEAPYREMCERMGLDPNEKKAIPFDLTDPKFRKAYFEVLHHPLEKEGVDFWWIDWQQGKKTKIPGLDPLWALNHYHTIDSAKFGHRPLTLSRYSGLGSHRYPLGFSGDTICSWNSLDFQPYFTNSAANSGYTWWSHDIGGHMRGIQDDELYLRWLQYGVFSPINRLHSTNSEFMGKEPWKRSFAVNKIAEQFLRLRHKLIPYLYTANYRTHTTGEPICMPMYYRFDTEGAYKVKNQYIFGGTLIVSPITKPMDKRLNLASVKVWLPHGRWTDIFTGQIYDVSSKDGRCIVMHRDIDSIPVLAPEGAIVPMYKCADTNDLSLDKPLEINIWRGNGEYELYEDDGESDAYKNGVFAKTLFTLKEENNTLTLTVTPPQNDMGLLPKERVFNLKFRDIKSGRLNSGEGLKDASDGRGTEFEIVIGNEPVSVEICDIIALENRDFEEHKNSILTRIQGKNSTKARQFKSKLPAYVRVAIEEMMPENN